MNPARIVLAAATISLYASIAAAPLPKLKVSENHRFLVAENGQPFFWLGDTAWELFYRLNREQAEQFLDNRAKHGFNIVQAVAIAELDFTSPRLDTVTLWIGNSSGGIQGLA